MTNEKQKQNVRLCTVPKERKRAIARISKRDLQDNIQYYLMMLPVIVLIIIFCYLPMFGIVIAFQDYRPGRPFFGEKTVWVGLKWFKEFTSSFYFTRILKNTIWLNILKLFMGFWVPIVFALLLNEVRFPKFKKTIQTLSYMPHFISSVVIAAMVLNFIADDGIVPKLLGYIGIQVKSLNANNDAFPWIYVITTVWQSFGWSSILYLSTLSSIDTALYEAAAIDGAHRGQQIWYITLPFMLPLIMIQLILQIGNILTANTELILLMYNPSVYSSMDVIGTYVYRDALQGGRFSYGTASGLLLSIMSFILVFIANKVSAKTTDFSLW